MDIENKRESSFKGSNPMEASSLGFEEIRLIIVVDVTTMRKQ